MKKWNMIIDVAECTNCQLCTLSAMDEYVGNDWPGVAAPMPRHGHRWIDILQKERGQLPMIDIATVGAGGGSIAAADRGGILTL